MPLTVKDYRTYKVFYDGDKTFAWLQRFNISKNKIIYQATTTEQVTSGTVGKPFKSEAEAEQYIQAKYDEARADGILDAQGNIKEEYR